MPLSTEEWLWGWDKTPGIVSVWAGPDGRAIVWRRVSGELIREEDSYRPWVLVDRLDGLPRNGGVTCRELEGPGELRFLWESPDARQLTHLRNLGKQSVLALPAEEQYLVATGRNYFRELSFDQLRRLQFDLETTGLDPARDRIFMIAVRSPDGNTEILEAQCEGNAAEADLIRRLVARIRALDPDVVENHNLHGFDLPFLDRRARTLGVPLALARTGPPGLRQRAAR